MSALIVSVISKVPQSPATAAGQSCCASGLCGRVVGRGLDRMQVCIVLELVAAGAGVFESVFS